MMRIAGARDKDALSDRVALASRFASEHHVMVVLKGSRSLIAAPDGRVFINATGNAGLGTAGAGDTLTGLIAGFVAQGAHKKCDVLDSVIAALYVGGLAGDFAARKLGMRTMIASDICETFSEAIRSLDEEGEQPPAATIVKLG
jgi:NAD(P)H-hydrate epimerase